MANRIQLRRGGAQEWANSNPTLAQGELGIELDTGRFKIGDGVTAWNSLRYERPVESTSNTANTLVQRDADGNFAAGTITSTLIGNASTASRLASTRQFQLADDVSATGVFDGSANLTLNTSLSLISTLPHYDGGLSGRQIIPYASKFIRYIKKKYSDVEVIAGGGIDCYDMVCYYDAIGADHFSLGTVCFNPIKLLTLIRKNGTTRASFDFFKRSQTTL